MINDPYQVLGVPRNATKEEIKKAYRQKARQYHPDTHPNDPEANRKMNEINEAYDMLTHPEKYAGRQQGGYGSSGYGSSGYGSSGYGSSGYGSSGYGSSGYGSSGQQKQNSGYGQNGYSGYNSSYGGPYGWSGNFDDFFSMFGNFYSQGSVNINPTEEPGDSPEIRAVIRYINSGQYTQALQLLSRMTSNQRNARWYYLCGLAYYGLKDISRAADFMRRAAQMEPGNRTYQQLYSQFVRSSASYGSGGYGGGGYGGSGYSGSGYGGSGYGSGGFFRGGSSFFSLRRLLIPILIIILLNWFLFGSCFGCYGGRGCFGNPYYSNYGQYYGNNGSRNDGGNTGTDAAEPDAKSNAIELDGEAIADLNYGG